MKHDPTRPPGAVELAAGDLGRINGGYFEDSVRTAREIIPGNGSTAGPSGTGKTLSAPLLGKPMPQEPVWFIGETEKN